MCKTAGRRCANSACATLDAKSAKLDEVAGKLRYASYDLGLARRAVEERPNSLTALRSLKAAETKAATLTKRHAKAVLDHSKAQKVYDSTPRGMRELDAKIDSATDPETKRSLQLRKKKAVAFRSIMVGQAKLKELQAKTGKSVAERRGRFIHMDDRNDTNTDVIYDEDTVPVAA